jgi:hypothetical protein
MELKVNNNRLKFLMDNERIQAGFPDGIFASKKSKFGYILEGLGMENFGTFYGHLVLFEDIRYILLPRVTFCGPLVHFTPFWSVVPRKIWQP